MIQTDSKPVKQLETMLNDTRFMRTVGKGLTDKVHSDEINAKRNDIARQSRKSGNILGQTSAKIDHWYSEYIALVLTDGAMENESETSTYLETVLGFSQKLLNLTDSLTPEGITLEKVANLASSLRNGDAEKKPFVTEKFIAMAKKALSNARNLTPQDRAEFLTASDAFERVYTETYNRYSKGSKKAKSTPNPRNTAKPAEAGSTDFSKYLPSLKSLEGKISKDDTRYELVNLVLGDKRVRTLLEIGYFGDVSAIHHTQQKYARTQEYSDNAKTLLDEKVIRKWDISVATDQIARQSGFLEEYLAFLNVYVLKSAGFTHGAKAIRTNFTQLMSDIKSGSLLTEVFFRRVRKVIVDKLPFEVFEKSKFARDNSEFFARYLELYDQVGSSLYPQSYHARGTPPPLMQGQPDPGQPKL